MEGERPKAKAGRRRVQSTEAEIGCGSGGIGRWIRDSLQVTRVRRSKYHKKGYRRISAKVARLLCPLCSSAVRESQ